jgi:uncharacterized alkaline shock family protein YloU
VIDVETKLGKITVSPYLVSQITAMAALESYGVKGIGRKRLGTAILTKMFGKKTYRGISVKFLDDTSVEIAVPIFVEFGVSIPEVVKNVIERIKYDVERLTSLKVKNVSVVVQGVKS